MPDGGSQTMYNQFGQPIQEMQTRGFDPIDSQLSLYMDVLNIFIRMVMIFGGGSGQRRK
jgi:FtsH-binding integral membrane protein